MALCEVGVTLGQCDGKSELSDKLQLKFSVSDFNEICETMYRTLGEFTLWPYVYQTLL
jgi:hypothetical protein